MTWTKNPGELTCPGCGTHNEGAICGMTLMNPIGDDETIVFIVCKRCVAPYFEVEWDSDVGSGFPKYMAKGPIDPAAFSDLADKVGACPEPFLRLCQCSGHKALADHEYCEFYRRGETTGGATVVDQSKGAQSNGSQRGGKTVTRQSGGARSKVPLTPDEERVTADVEDAVSQAGGDLTVLKKSMDWARGKLGRTADQAPTERLYWGADPQDEREYEALVADVLRRAGDDQTPPIVITNGIIDWTSADEWSDVLRGIAPGGWNDPDCTHAGSVSRELDATCEIIQEAPFHAQRDYREFSFITLDSPTVEPGKPALNSAFRRVLNPLIELKSSANDNLYGWLNVIFAFCPGKPVAYYSQYVPSANVHVMARRHSVQVLHRPLDCIPDAELTRHRSFRLLRLSKGQWEELEREGPVS